MRRLALCRQNKIGNTLNKNYSLDDDTETWQRGLFLSLKLLNFYYKFIVEHTAAEAGVLEDVSNVYLGGRLCALRQSKIVIEPQDVGSYYFRHCFAGRRK